MKTYPPAWLLRNLGRYVMLKEEFNDGIDCWPAGTLLVLQSVQAGAGTPYVTLSPVDDLTLEENFSVDAILPYRDGFQDVARPVVF